MTLYILNGRGIWGDVNSHPLPVTVELFPSVELGSATVNGSPVPITDGKLTIADLAQGINTVTVNGVECEPLYCREINGSIRRANAIGGDLREILPVVAQIASLEERFGRIEAQFNQKDFFG